MSRAPLRSGLTLLATAIAGGCFDNPGVDPPDKDLNFPIALALAPADGPGEPSRLLFVANANFDLRYNAGSVQAYDLDAIDACVFGEPTCFVGDDCVLVPAGFQSDERDPVEERVCEGMVTGEVFVGSFASGLEVSSDGQRLFVPIRSDVNLTTIEVGEQGALSCNADDPAPHRCSAAYRCGDTPAGERDLEMPPDPVGVIVGPLSDFPAPEANRPPPAGSYALVAHRGGRASLFLDQGGAVPCPQLVDVVGDLPRELTGITLEPRSGLAWMPSSRLPQIARVGVALDPQDLTDTVLFNAGSLPVRGLDTGRSDLGDTRDVQMDPRPDSDRAYVVSRRPEALLFVDLERTTPGALAIDEVLDVCIGPSRVQVASLADPGGAEHPVAFLSCFDSRELFVVDLVQRHLIAVIRGMGGPFELAVDPVRQRIYVADFSRSVVHVADLAPIARCLGSGMTTPEGCSPRIQGSIGRPRAVRELR